MDKAKEQGFAQQLISISGKIEKKLLVRVIRDGLVTMIPLLMIGGFALILQTLPISTYQNFIGSFADGFFYNVFHAAYMATFGVMSVYMAISFSISFFSTCDPGRRIDIWGILTALCSFLIFDGVASDSFSIGNLGAASVFLAMVSSIGASALYRFLLSKIAGNRRNFAYGVDSRMNAAIAALFPAMITIGSSALISYFVTLTGRTTVYQLVTDFFVSLFEIGSSIFGKGLAFVCLSSILWCFGIHGGDCLQGASDRLFVPLQAINAAAVAAGEAPTEILCKQFFDCFILMGGCGSAICLLIAILIASRDKGMREIARTAAFPMIFNINELMVFGLPVVFNPILCIPFILVPVLQYLIAYLACSLGLVPLITSAVEWTTPIILGGYSATGSVAGSILQAVNLAVGVLIYIPFVRMMGRVHEDRETANLDEYISWYKANESDLCNVRLSELQGIYGDLSKKIVLDLKNAIETKQFEIRYQPQYDYDGKCIGVEALLRLPLVRSTYVYPPLLIQLAHESGRLEELEEGILSRVLSERDAIFRKFGNDIKISVNVTGYTIAQDKYWDFLKKAYTDNPFSSGALCIEITEQAAIEFNRRLEERFRECHDIGIMFAIDDFSMGQTSINYLKGGLFDFLKLDGALVRGMKDNPRCREIVASIVAMAESLHINTIAEYVETEELRAILHETGCNNYQGYLFSPAVPLE